MTLSAIDILQQSSAPQLASSDTSTPLGPTQESCIQVCLLGAAFGTGNLGVGALACGTISAILRTFPAARIYLVDYGKEPQSHEVHCHHRRVNVQLVNLRFSKKFFLKNNVARLLLTALGLRLLPTPSLRRKLIGRNAYLKAIYDANIITSIAGGDSFSDIYGIERLIYVSLPPLLVLALGKPLILLPQTIGPFQSMAGRWIARLILRRAKNIYTRDLESLETVARLLGREPENLRQAYDMGFALEPLPPPRVVQAQVQSAKSKGVLVGLNVSGLLYQGGYTRRNQFGLRADYRNLVRRLITALIEESHSRVLLVPHVFGARNTEADNHAIQELWGELSSTYGERLEVLRDQLDPYQVKWVIGQCDFFVGSRMHACIAALSQGVPAVALAYSGKFIGIMKSIGMEGLVADLRSLEIDDVIRLVSETLKERDTYSRALKVTVETVRERVINLFKEFAPLSGV